MRRLHHRRGSTRIVIPNGALVSIVTMVAVGLLLAGLGFVFVVVGATTSILRSFVGTGVVLGLVGLGMFGFGVISWFRRNDPRRLLEEGVAGQARVVRVTDAPGGGAPAVDVELEVITAIHDAYSVTRRETPPDVVRSRLVPNAVFSVKVDRDEPKLLVILWDS